MFRIFLAIKCRVTCCVPASYSVYTVIAGVNLNNLKANHNTCSIQCCRILTVIAGVNLNNLKANHNRGRHLLRPCTTGAYRRAPHEQPLRNAGGQPEQGRTNIILAIFLRQVCRRAHQMGERALLLEA